MPWEPDYIEDGERATAASVNGRLQDGIDWINAINQRGLANGAFNFDQALGPISTLTASGFTVYGDHGIHRYNEATFGTSLTYITFAANGGTEATGSYTGQWTIIGHPDVAGGYTGPLAKLQLHNGVSIGMSNGSRTGAVLVLLNLQWERYTFADGGLADLVVCIQFKTIGGSTWYTIPVTESHVSAADHKITALSANETIDIDIPIATLITVDTLTEAGLDPTTAVVTHVRAMVSIRNPTIMTSVTLHRWNMTAIPLHCEVV